MIRRLFFLSGLLTFACAAPAAELHPEIIAGPATTTSTDLDTGETIIKGDAQIIYGNALLTADEIRYNPKTGVAVAKGHATYTRGTLRVLADTLTYHLADGSYTVENVRLGEYPIYIEGASATGTKDEITVNQATITYHEPGPFQPTVKADKIVYAPGQHLRAESASAGVGRVRPFPFPKFQQSLHEPAISYVSVSAGFRGSLGAFGDLGLRLPVTPDVKLGGDISFFTKRGLMFGPAGRYESGSDGADLSGYFRSGFINDHGDKQTDVLGRPIGENRGYFEWEHQQRIGENLTLNGQLNYWKDSAILRDFRPDAFFNVQEPDTFVESVYTGHNYFVSAFVRYQPNSFQEVQQRLPEVRFDLLPLAVGGGFYEQFNASAARLREDPAQGGPQLRSDRYDAYYALTRPFTPREWLGITPVAGARVTHYANTSGITNTGAPILPGGATRVLGELGFDAALRASATFDYQNAFWKINGLRHLLTPRLSYRYIPGADRDSRYIPAIDRRTHIDDPSVTPSSPGQHEEFTEYLPPLGLDNTRNLDDLHPTNAFRLGIDNTVQTRDAIYGSRDLLVFNIAGDFRIHREPGEKDFSAVHTEMAFMPARWLQVDVYESFSPQNFTLRELNSGVTLHDGDAWSVRFASNYLADQIEDYLIEGRMRLNEIFEARTRLQYDARKSRFNQQSYGIVQNLANTWQISYLISLYSGRQRESAFGFSVQIETLRF